METESRVFVLKNTSIVSL
uniref:Uncharacterized protein n=1 Tax=Anguilla anguilla TaxID=7936 RepID=A0A0E9VHS4_ANGAN